MINDSIKTHLLQLANCSIWIDSGYRYEDWQFVLDNKDIVEIGVHCPHHFPIPRIITSMLGPKDEVDYIAEVLLNGGFEQIVSSPTLTMEFLPKKIDREPAFFVSQDVWADIQKWNSDPIVKEIGEKLGTGAYHKKCERCNDTGIWVMFNKTVDCECGTSAAGD